MQPKEDTREGGGEEKSARLSPSATRLTFPERHILDDVRRIRLLLSIAPTWRRRRRQATQGRRGGEVTFFFFFFPLPFEVVALCHARLLPPPLFSSFLPPLFPCCDFCLYLLPTGTTGYTEREKKVGSPPFLPPSVSAKSKAEEEDGGDSCKRIVR